MSSPRDRARTLDVSLLKTLSEQAVATPEAIYVIDVEDRALTYGQTIEEVRRWAFAYRRAGVVADQHVVTMQHNSIESLLGWLGLAWLGAVEAPVNTDYRGALLINALNLTQAPTMLVLEQYLDRVIAVADDLTHLKTVIVLDAKGEMPKGPFELVSGEAFMHQAVAAEDLVLPKPWDIMAVLFTSGTTGPSKAVRLPWAQIHAMSTGTFPVEDLGPGDVIYNPGPTYHVGAKVFPYLAALSGGRHVMRPFISSSAMGDDYRKYGVTTGAIVAGWIKDPPSPDDAERPLRNVLTALDHPLAAPFSERFGCRRFGCFNMTELSSPIHYRGWDAVIHDEVGRMSCGVVREGYEARIVDVFDQPVPVGETGELIVRADAPWVLNAGYLNNPEATQQAWRNGWFHTGDAFVADAAGNFFFVDRMKDCIRRRGENISSLEVESYVDAHPAIARSAAVAIKRGDHAGADEEIKIVVERVPGQTLEAEHLVRWLIPRTPRFMIPRYVEFIDALPLTPTMKVQKARLRQTGVDGDVWDREAAGIELPRHIPAV